MTVYVPDDRWTPQLLYIESQLFYASGQRENVPLERKHISIYRDTRFRSNGLSF